MPKLRKSTDRNSKLICCEGGQDTSACQISGSSFYMFSWKCLQTPNLTRFLCQNSGKIRNINRPLPKSDQFCRLSGHMSMTNFRTFLWCLFWEEPGNLSGQTDRQENHQGWSDQWRTFAWRKIIQDWSDFVTRPSLNGSGESFKNINEPSSFWLATCLLYVIPLFGSFKQQLVC